MHETETSPVESPEVAATLPERSNRAIDLSNRPDPGWLDTVQSEIDDIDLVLKCLGRDSAKICQTCDTAQANGELEARPMLARCAGTKQPR